MVAIVWLRRRFLGDVRVGTVGCCLSVGIALSRLIWLRSCSVCNVTPKADTTAVFVVRENEKDEKGAEPEYALDSLPYFGSFVCVCVRVCCLPSVVDATSLTFGTYVCICARISRGWQGKITQCTFFVCTFFLCRSSGVFFACPLPSPFFLRVVTMTISISMTISMTITTTRYR